GELIHPSAAPPTAKGSAFRLEYGLFESILAIDGIPQLWEDHYSRFASSCTRLFRDCAQIPARDRLRSSIDSTIAANPACDEQRIRVQFGMFPGFESPTYLVEVLPLPPGTSDFNEKGWIAGIGSDTLKSNDHFANLKAINIPLYNAASALCEARGWDDVILMNEQGYVMETGMGNLFAVKKQVLYTPSPSSGGIDGVMKKHIVREATTRGYRVVVGPLRKSDLKAADELFMSNAIRRIKWISRLEEREYTNMETKTLHAQLF
ncbi:MAG: hypothetical protein EOO04_32700, partial [Chitinophagaceae bacterium]